MDDLGPNGFVVVGHDWGGPLAVELHRRTGRVAGVAVMESRLHALPSWGDFDEGGRDVSSAGCAGRERASGWP